MADRTKGAGFLCIVGAVGFLGWGGAAHASKAAVGPPQIRLLSPGAGPIPDAAGGVSAGGGISADGRYAVFVSSAANLVPVESATDGNVFLYDRVAGTRTLVSHSAVTPGATANGLSYGPLLSADGRWVVYSSVATDLVAGQSDTPGTPDVFLYDRQTDTNRLLSRASGTVATATGLAYSPAIDDDGSVVVFTSAASNLLAGQNGNTTSVYLYDRGADALSLASHSASGPTATANGGSVLPRLSGDGRYTVYSSVAADLVPGQIAGPVVQNVYLYDRTTGANRLVSHASTSATTGGNADSFAAVLSDDGSTLAFASSATNLLGGIADGNNGPDVFLYDRATASLTLVSRSAASPAATGNAYSSFPVLSADGRYLAFTSSATNLLSGVSDSNNGTDVFLYDRTTAALTLVSRTAGAASAGNGLSDAPAISADGRFVAFETQATDLTSPSSADPNQAYDVYLFDRTTGAATLVSHAFDTPNGTGAGNSQFPLVSADGAWVLFTSSAPDLDGTALDFNRSNDVFLYNRSNGGSSLVSRRDPALPSVTASGASSTPAVSADGRWVTFVSDAVNLAAGISADPSRPGLFLLDTLSGALTLANPGAADPHAVSNGLLTSYALAKDGQSLAYASTATDVVPGQVDTNGDVDVFLYDRPSARSVLVSHRAGAPQTAASAPVPNAASLSLSPDGRFLAYASAATDLVAGQVDANNAADIFLYDRTTGASTLVSHAAGAPAKTGDNVSFRPQVSEDGRFVAYTSDASDLVAGVSPATGDDVYLFDRATGANALVTHSAGLFNTRAGGNLSDMTPDGRFLLLTATGLNLVPGQVDNNGTYDVFVWDRVTGGATLLSHTAASATTTGNGTSWGVGLSADGRFALWQSQATDLLPGQPGGGDYSLFLTDLVSGTTTLVAHGFVFTAPRLTADGAFVYFTLLGTQLVPPPPGIPFIGIFQLYVYDRVAGTTTLVSHTAGDPGVPSSLGVDEYAVSADGTAVPFSSLSPDLVAADFNNSRDVFLATLPVPGSAFFTLPPCRLFDSRQAGPPLPAGVPLRLATRGLCGIPETARAIAANVTVTQPTLGGYLSLYPGDTALPATSGLNFSAGQTRSNNTVLRLSFDGRGYLNVAPVLGGAGTVQVVVDVTGYFQ